MMKTTIMNSFEIPDLFNKTKPFHAPHLLNPVQMNPISYTKKCKRTRGESIGMRGKKNCHAKAGKKHANRHTFKQKMWQKYRHTYYVSKSFLLSALFLSVGAKC